MITFLWVKISLSLVDCLPTFRRNLISPFLDKNTDCSSTLKMKATGVFTNVVNDLQNCTAADRADLCSSNALDMHLSNTQFESRHDAGCPD
jgi:hypothetical protein